MQKILVLALFAGVVFAQENAPNPGGAGGPGGAKDDPAVNKEVVKAVRAWMSAKPVKSHELLEALLARPDLDWPSVKKGCETGRYYPALMATEFGIKHSKNLGANFEGQDGVARGFSFIVPKGYDHKKKSPVLMYLHHNSMTGDRRTMAGSVVVPRFLELADDGNFIFVAPSTNAGAAWWTKEGQRYVTYTLDWLRRKYNVDEDKISVMGAIDGGSACWLLAQEMPDVFSAILPLTGNPLSSASIRPLYLGTLDRMDVFMGITGKNGGQNHNQMLDVLAQMFNHGMRITVRVVPGAKRDVRYFGEVLPYAVQFALSKEREPLKDEVDIATDMPKGQRSLWLQSHGVDPKGEKANRFGSTLFKIPEGKPRGKPKKKLGVGLRPRKGFKGGLLINKAEGAAQRGGVEAGDVLTAVNGVPVNTAAEVGAEVKKTRWGGFVELTVVRTVPEADVEMQKERQKRYLKRVGKRIAAARKLRKEGKDADVDIDDIEDDDDDDDDDDDECSSISGGEDEDDGEEEKPVAGADVEKRAYLTMKKYVRIRRPEPILVRGDFGAGWNRESRKKGVMLQGIMPRGFADRAGFKNGDRIVKIGDTDVKNVKDIRKFLEEDGFKFEKEADGERWLDFTVLRHNKDRKWEEKNVRAEWSPPPHASRVDARWDKAEDSLHILTNSINSFTVYFTDELIPPGRDFHLYINGVPYHDLADPATMPEYPDPMPTDGPGKETLKQMRKKRAKVPGWTPDPKFALEDFKNRKDRRLVFGAKRTYDMTKFKAGFDKARAYYHALAKKRGEAIDAAIEEAMAKAEKPEGVDKPVDEPEDTGAEAPNGGE